MLVQLSTLNQEGHNSASVFTSCLQSLKNQLEVDLLKFLLSRCTILDMSMAF